MRITKKFIVAGAGVVTLVAGGGAAFAATAAAPKITAERAIQIAHQAVPGAWVSEVDHDTRGTRPDIWEVELVKGTQRYEVYVDAATGRITHRETKRTSQGDDSRHGGRDGQDDDHGGDHHGGRNDRDDH